KAVAGSFEGCQTWRTASPAAPARPASSQSRAPFATSTPPLMIGHRREERREHGHAAEEEDPEDHQAQIDGADDAQDHRRLGDALAPGGGTPLADGLELLAAQ